MQKQESPEANEWRKQQSNLETGNAEGQKQTGAPCLSPAWSLESIQWKHNVKEYTYSSQISYVKQIAKTYLEHS